MTGKEILVKSYPINLPMSVHKGTTSFSGLKNGSCDLVGFLPALYSINAADPRKFLKFIAD